MSKSIAPIVALVLKVKHMFYMHAHAYQFYMHVCACTNKYLFVDRGCGQINNHIIYTAQICLH